MANTTVLKWDWGAHDVSIFFTARKAQIGHLDKRAGVRLLPGCGLLGIAAYCALLFFTQQ